MNTFYKIIGIVVIVLIGFWVFNSYANNAKEPNKSMKNSKVEVIPITHATAVIKMDDVVIYVDPVGGAEAFVNQPRPDIVLVTDVHSDHLSTSTLSEIVGDATLIVPQAVSDMLSADMAEQAKILDNGETLMVKELKILAMPMYNLPESPDAHHVKGRGNGYLIASEGSRVYVAGDTEGIPEMLALEDIDVALIPMNLPYTMSVEDAAKAVLAFKPKQVYPYHYRGPNGLSDVDKFKSLVNASDSNIEVVLVNWYP